MQLDTDPAGGIMATAEEQIAYNVPHAAKVLDLSERQMWKLVRGGEIDSFKMGNSRRIRRTALLDYINRMSGDTHPPAGPSTPPPPSGPKAKNERAA